MRKVFIFSFLIVAVLNVFGCAYTQEDYDLQEKYQERQREIDEERKKDSYTVRW